MHCNSARRLNDRPSGGEVVTNHSCQAARWECKYSPTGQQLQDHFGGHDILTTVTINNHTSISHCLDNRTLPSVFTQAFQRLLGSSCCQFDDHDMLKPVHPTHAHKIAQGCNASIVSGSKLDQCNVVLSPGLMLRRWRCKNKTEVKCLTLEWLQALMACSLHI